MGFWNVTHRLVPKDSETPNADVFAQEAIAEQVRFCVAAGYSKAIQRMDPHGAFVCWFLCRRQHVA